MPVQIYSPSIPSPPQEDLSTLPWVSVNHLVPFKPTGLLLYLTKAHYESGMTALAGWVPLEVETGLEEREGTQKLARLVEEWKGGMVEG